MTSEHAIKLRQIRDMGFASDAIKKALGECADRLEFLENFRQISSAAVDPGREFKDSETWIYVFGFARMMEAKLDRNREKGDRPEWLKCDLPYLAARIDEEIEELHAAINANEPDPRLIFSEAADVANFAMMLADVASDGAFFGDLEDGPL